MIWICRPCTQAPQFAALRAGSPLTYDICRAYAAKGAKWRDTAKTQSWCEKAISLQLEDTYLVLGTLAEERNDFSKAAELYKKAVEAGDSSASGSLGIECRFPDYAEASVSNSLVHP